MKVDELIRESHLEQQGLLPPRETRESVTRKLKDLSAEFLADLKARGRAPNTLTKYTSRLNVLFSECGWTCLRDITARDFCQWRARCGKAPKTVNDILAVTSMLLDWLKRQRMIVANPLEGIDKVSNRGRPRFRRALSEEELGRLLNVSPPFRQIVYLFMAETGLRRAEVNELKVGDFNFESPAPYVRARASTTKNRKEATIWLRPHMVEGIKSIFPDNPQPSDWVFHELVPRITTLKRDLAKAGIEFENENGRADLHALRVTFGTNLALAGVHPRVTQELMRHSDINLTMKIYTDVSQLGVASAIEKLPVFGTTNGNQLRSVIKTDELSDRENDTQIHTHFVCTDLHAASQRVSK